MMDIPKLWLGWATARLEINLLCYKPDAELTLQKHRKINQTLPRLRRGR
jgi:hypothetical protein